MAKDDYYVIVGRILVYLYQRLKKKTDKGIEYLQPNTKDFPIDEEYFNYVIEHMVKQGLIEGVKVTRAWGGDVVSTLVTESTRITPAGIDYLQDNSKIRKAISLIPQAASIMSLFE